MGWQCLFCVFSAKVSCNCGGVETSLKGEMMLDQQLMTAFQAGLRHSLDDPDHDAMSDL